MLYSRDRCPSIRENRVLPSGLVSLVEEPDRPQDREDLCVEDLLVLSEVGAAPDPLPVSLPSSLCGQSWFPQVSSVHGIGHVLCRRLSPVARHFVPPPCSDAGSGGGRVVYPMLAVPKNHRTGREG